MKKFSEMLTAMESIADLNPDNYTIDLMLQAMRYVDANPKREYTGMDIVGCIWTGSSYRHSAQRAAMMLSGEMATIKVFEAAYDVYKSPLPIGEKIGRITQAQHTQLMNGEDVILGCGEVITPIYVACAFSDFYQFALRRNER